MRGNPNKYTKKETNIEEKRETYDLEALAEFVDENLDKLTQEQREVYDTILYYISNLTSVCTSGGVAASRRRRPSSEFHILFKCFAEQSAADVQSANPQRNIEVRVPHTLPVIGAKRGAAELRIFDFKTLNSMVSTPVCSQDTKSEICSFAAPRSNSNNFLSKTLKEDVELLIVT